MSQNTNSTESDVKITNYDILPIKNEWEVFPNNMGITVLGINTTRI